MSHSPDAVTAPVLIVGAGGQVGSTGNSTARQLLAAGVPVRAFVHHDDERAEALRALGAEIVAGDLLDMQGLRSALTGVRRAYFTYPVADGLVHATAAFVAVGKQEGLEWVVNMSQMIAGQTHPSPASRQHWLAERVLDWSGIGVTHLRPPYFAEMVPFFGAATIASEGKILLPWGRGRSGMVSADDLARVIATILQNPEPHRGRTYFPTGPELVTVADIAAACSRVLGRDVEYVDIPVQDFAKTLSEMGAPDHAVDHLSEAALAHQRGEFDRLSTDIYDITGVKPQSIEEFVRGHEVLFGATQPAGI